MHYKTIKQSNYFCNISRALFSDGYNYYLAFVGKNGALLQLQQNEIHSAKQATIQAKNTLNTLSNDNLL